MKKYVLVATSSAVAGREEEYNTWYDDVHVKDVLAIPGVKSCRRFSASPAPGMELPGQFLAIYEIEAEDGGAVIAELGRRAKSGEMQMTDSIDRTASHLGLWEEQA
ncbi:hypothetical protein [Novosphingobium malaysiense]|uniref:hypothetical protein n=1 Tax=Novosphingobium malaysiense TaxID=1348853 RepID=UPI0006903737|nr:hypothetical protein [Novosphingobium malaysiense]